MEFVNLEGKIFIIMGVLVGYMAEVAKVLQVSRERVRQLEGQAMKGVRNSYRGR